MNENSPIVAIVGSARHEVVGDKEETARQACYQLGQKLVEAGWRLAVYSSDTDFIEQDVIDGYISTEKAAKHSITAYYPFDATVEFKQKDSHAHLFQYEVTTSSDWEVSFYHSLARVNGILLMGGGSSTLIAGHVALSRGLPTVAIEHFGGNAQKIWQHLSSKPALIEDKDVQAMAQWTAKSAEDCVKSLAEQYDRFRNKLNEEESAQAAIKAKALKWDEHLREDKAGKWVLLFVFIFSLFLLSGLVITNHLTSYTIIAVFGLAAAGGLGGALRMSGLAAPDSKRGNGPVYGVAVGFIFGILYLLPQMTSDSSILKPTTITSATRFQYVSAMMVALMAGLAFDSALEQLFRRAKERETEITKNA